MLIKIFCFFYFQNLEFHGVMRFYFQDSGQKIATKCIRVASDATVSDVIGEKANLCEYNDFRLLSLYRVVKILSHNNFYIMLTFLD